MNRKDLAEQLKYSSSKWLYVVAWNNLLKQLFCPFKASVLSQIGPLQLGQIVYVQEVNVTSELKTVFIVDGSAYYYYHFNILLD